MKIVFVLFIIQDGNMKSVQNLISGVQVYGDITRFSSMLFVCIDNKQTEIAKYLIGSGFKSDIWKEVGIYTCRLYEIYL